MNIYLGDQAKRLYFSRDIPLNTIGVFQSIKGEWLYWYCTDWTFDTGFADTEAEALRVVKKNFIPLNYIPLEDDTRTDDSHRDD